MDSDLFDVEVQESEGVKPQGLHSSDGPHLAVGFLADKFCV